MSQGGGGEDPTPPHSTTHPQNSGPGASGGPRRRPSRHTAGSPPLIGSTRFLSTLCPRPRLLLDRHPRRAVASPGVRVRP